MSSATRERPSDCYPACPECESDVFVDGSRSDADYVCRLCERRFDE